MKYKKTVLSIFLIVSVILISLMLYITNKSMGENHVSLSEFSSLHRLTNHEINSKDSGLKIPYVQFNDNVFSFKNRKKPIMILRIKDDYCSTCVENEIKMVKLLKNELKDNLCLFISVSSTRNIKRLMKKYKMEIPCQDIPYNFLDDLYSEKFHAPYYFLLHEDMSISNTHLPEKQLPKLTMEYFETVKRFLSD